MYWQMYVHGIPYIIRITIGWKHTTRGPLWRLSRHVCNIYFAKCVAFNFGIHFWCLSLIFLFSKY
jgi:hypothetical protein